MSADGSIEITWADDQHRFRLPIGGLRELQDKTNAGPAEILERFRAGTWRVDDVREVIRIGLIGGGKQPTASLSLVIRYVDGRPLMESVPVAFSVLAAALIGVPDDQPGKAEPEETAQPDGSASPSFMAREPRSGFTPEPSMN